jgi:hypothetical protein
MGKDYGLAANAASFRKISGSSTCFVLLNCRNRPTNLAHLLRLHLAYGNQAFVV